MSQKERVKQVRTVSCKEKPVTENKAKNVKQCAAGLQEKRGHAVCLSQALLFYNLP
jgi:hypothetical protein